MAILIFPILATSECDVGNGGCDHYCTETIDSYTCSCYEGYQLEADGHNCTGKRNLSSLIHDKTK